MEWGGLGACLRSSKQFRIVPIELVVCSGESGLVHQGVIEDDGDGEEQPLPRSGVWLLGGPARCAGDLIQPHVVRVDDGVRQRGEGHPKSVAGSAPERL